MMKGADIKIILVKYCFMCFLRLFSAFSLIFVFLTSCSSLPKIDTVSSKFEHFVSSEITVGNISRITLNNGLQIVIYPNDRIPIASQMIWYKTGENFGIKDKKAVTHFLEHAVFQGTKKYPADYFSNFIHKTGSKENAYVTPFGIAFFQRFRSNHLEKIIILEADRMNNVQFSEQGIVSERKIILQEISRKKEWDFEKKKFNRINKMLLGDHAFTLSVWGSADDVRDVKLADLKETYTRYFRPSNAILIYTGDVSRNQILELVVKYFGSIIDYGDVLKRNQGSSNFYELEKNKFAISRNKDNFNPLFMRAYKFPSASEYIKDLAASGNRVFNEVEKTQKATELFYTSEVFGQFMSQKLTGYIYRKLTVAPSKAIWPGGEYNFTVKYGGKLNVYVLLPHVKNAQEAEKELSNLEDYVDQIIYDLVKKGVSLKDLQRVKNHLAGEAIYAEDDAISILKYTASVEKDGLDFKEHLYWQKNIQNVTKKNFDRLLRIVLEKNKHVTLYMVGTDSLNDKGFEVIERRRDK